jgi:hypothetical protein
MRAILISFICVLLFCKCVYAETIVAEGTAFIGSGITLEEAKTIALNDAKQKALNSLGVFVESESKVVDGRLTKDEIRSITGAVMSSAILEEGKEIIGDSFVLKLKVRFDISKPSFQRSIKNYQNRSSDRRTIDHLTRTISNLQKNLISRKEADRHSVELVNEINYSTKRLHELLTTKQVIDYELQMQTLYKNKIRENFKTKTLLPFSRELCKILFWNTIPTMEDGDLQLKFIGCKKFIDSDWEYMKKLHYILEYYENLKYIGLSRLDEIAREYDSLHLKIHPKMKFEISYNFPIHVFVNGEKISEYFEVKFSGCSVRGRYNSVLEGKFGHGMYFFPIRSSDTDNCEIAGISDIHLPKNYTLSNIEDIHIRVGEVNPQNIKFSFFGTFSNP